MPNNDYSFIRDLREDFIYNLYQQMRSSGNYPSLFSICNAIEKMPMPIHFISYRMGRAVYTNYFQAHNYQPHKSQQRRLLYDSYIEACQSYIDKHPGASPNVVVENACISPAPCIGLTCSQIFRVLSSRGAK